MTSTTTSVDSLILKIEAAQKNVESKRLAMNEDKHGRSESLFSRAVDFFMTTPAEATLIKAEEHLDIAITEGRCSATINLSGRTR